MKTFIYTKKERRATYGMNVTLEVYRMKRNDPHHVCTVKFNSGSTSGECTEVLRAAALYGELPKKYMHKHYAWQMQETDGINICRVG